MSTRAAFQRARRPEQVEERRRAILDVASALLGERPIAEISLTELSERVGLAKSNVLRYFDSREAIFLEVLGRAWSAWLDEVGTDLRTPGDGHDAGPYGREAAVASAIAASLLERPLLCELISAMAAVLERNVSIGTARIFKRQATENTGRLADLVRERIPELTEAGAAHFAGAVFVLVAGMWPFATPPEAVAAVSAELGAPPAREMFADGLREGLTNQLVGLVVRTEAR
ncbi:TetR family transcriptional regulator [Microbispora corallina]|uniref:TetR family transcriptional regulator n=1 Tax=Microbispora corallina TaxID=83302 RepID=A0ABQ4GC25_9ACTN|nr:TetR family transcriptional regulator [Microbispora corallina]GIH44639.1 TetR family transcriptional regulator [Microbispora corallina]